MTGNGKATGIVQHAGASSQALKMSRGSRAALLCGTKEKLAVRLPPVALAQANQGSLLAPVHGLDWNP